MVMLGLEKELAVADFPILSHSQHNDIWKHKNTLALVQSLKMFMWKIFTLNTFTAQKIKLSIKDFLSKFAVFIHYNDFGIAINSRTYFIPVFHFISLYCKKTSKCTKGVN